jgi:GH25 family lysozyme M1 (1,4-beta-N-acetylmuramidase)
VLLGQLLHRLDGIDGSHWQPDAGPLDLPKTREATQWIAWKATQGTAYVDPTFRNVRRQVADLKFRNRLFYHWLTPTASATTQANHYLKTLGPLNPGDGVMLDAEESGITELTCLAWLNAVEAVTRRPASVYTGLYVAGGTLWKSPRIRQSQYGPRPMHLAAYLTPQKLWDRLKATGTTLYPIHAWQWSSNGPAPGVTGRCDLNQVIDRDIYDRACGIPEKPAPEPAPEPAPVSEEDDVDIATNAEQWGSFAPGVAKMVVTSSGKLRHISGPEWKARGSLYGNELSNEDIYLLGMV